VISKTGRPTMYFSNLLFTLLGVILSWIPAACFWARDRFTSTKAPWITFRVRPPHRPGSGAMFQCKIFVDLTNQLPAQPARIADAYFVFKKRGSLKPDPKWSSEHGTGRFPVLLSVHSTARLARRLSSIRRKDEPVDWY